MPKYFSFSFIAFFFCVACSSDTTTLPERPRDPWVFRSVLDQQPRMITLALNEVGYAAYDLEACALYKVWRGGVHLNGAVFNNVKTVQPTTWGTAYWERVPTEPVWWVKDRAERIPKNALFKSYTLKKNQIHLHYELDLGHGQKAIIRETPELIADADGQVLFTRTFTTENIPDGVRVFNQEYELPVNATATLTVTFDPLEPTAPTEQASGHVSQYWLERSGCDTCHEYDETTIGPSYMEIAQQYAPDEATLKNLTAKVKDGGSGVWGTVPMNPHPQLNEPDITRMVSYILSLAPLEEEIKKPKEMEIPLVEESKTPGFGAALTGVHPSYELTAIRPASFKPRVGGMDFLPDGRLVVSTWDSIGAVYALSGVETGDSSQVQVQLLASGLAEPLGLKVVDGDIYVMQKNELTQLVDHDGDGITDEYRAICNTFGVTADFHEYSYGLEYKTGFFYATLGLAMRLMDHELQHPDRGTVLRVTPDGSFEKIVTGLRQPNGIGAGPDGELFITENQGNWVPACKLIHVQEGDFHGCLLESGGRFDGLTAKPPAVWLPQDEIGNSPGQPLLVPDGPYQGQMLHGEVTHGGIKRVFLEKINSQYQGCVFRFSQGLEAGINRMVWGPDGALYVGGVGMNGNWAWQGNQYGLQRLKYNGKSTFEILAIRATAQGFEIEFTEPLAKTAGNQAADYALRQWWYQATAAYGGPKLDLENLVIQKVTVSEDRKKVQLQLPGLKPEHVIYFYLGEHFTSASGQKLWTGESWYTLNSIPE